MAHATPEESPTEPGLSKASGGSTLSLPPWPLGRPQPLPCQDSNPDGAPTAVGVCVCVRA